MDVATWQIPPDRLPETDYKGQELVRIWDIERRYCAHSKYQTWMDFFGESETHNSIQFCRYLVSSLWEEEIERGDNRLARKQGQLLQKLLRKTSPGQVTELFSTGNKLNPNNKNHWLGLQYVLIFLLLGIDNACAEDERWSSVARIMTLFFDRRKNKDVVPIFFDTTLGTDNITRPIEGAYDFLWLALQDNEQRKVIAVSGGPPFGQATHDRLTLIGEMTVALAASGARVLFVYPREMTQDNKVVRSVQWFGQHASAAVNGTLPDFVKIVCPDDTQSKARKGLSRILRYPADPPVVSNGRWVGQYFNFMFKFIYQSTGMESRLYFARREGTGSFGGYGTPEECRLFEDWLAALIDKSWNDATTMVDGADSEFTVK